MSIEPRNLTAQLHHRAAGNPPSTLPGLRDLQLLSRAGVRLPQRLAPDLRGHRAARGERARRCRADGALERLEDRFLLEVAGAPTCSACAGRRPPRRTRELRASPGSSGPTRWPTCWRLGRRAGAVRVLRRRRPRTTETVELRVRPLFARSPVTDEVVPLIDEEIAAPGRAHPEPVLAVAERLPRMRLLLLGGQPARLRQRRADGPRGQHRQQLDGPQPRAEALRAGHADNPCSSATRTSSATGRGCCGSSSRAATMTELFELSAPRHARTPTWSTAAPAGTCSAQRQPALRRRRATWDAAATSCSGRRRRRLTDLLGRLGVDAPAYVDDTPLDRAAGARAVAGRRAEVQPRLHLLLRRRRQLRRPGREHAAGDRAGLGRPAVLPRRPRGAGQPRLPRRRAAGQPRRAPRGHRAGRDRGRRARHRRHASRSPPTAPC